METLINQKTKSKILKKNVRIYTITVECTGAAENSLREPVNVFVPYDNGKKNREFLFEFLFQ